MEIHKVPTPWLKALSKHNTNNVHQDNKCYLQFNKQLTQSCTHQPRFKHNYVQDAHTHCID